MNDLPLEHIEDALTLTGQAYRNLFEILLYPSGSLYLTPEATITWRAARTYERES